MVIKFEVIKKVWLSLCGYGKPIRPDKSGRIGFPDAAAGTTRLLKWCLYCYYKKSNCPSAATEHHFAPINRGEAVFLMPLPEQSDFFNIV